MAGAAMESSNCSTRLPARWASRATVEVPVMTASTACSSGCSGSDGRDRRSCGLSCRAGRVCEGCGRTMRVQSGCARTLSRQACSTRSGRRGSPRRPGEAGCVAGSGWSASRMRRCGGAPSSARSAIPAARVCGALRASKAGLPVTAMRSGGHPARMRLSRTASDNTQTRLG